MMEEIEEIEEEEMIAALEIDVMAATKKDPATGESCRAGCARRAR